MKLSYFRDRDSEKQSTEQLFLLKEQTLLAKYSIHINRN